MRALRNVLKSTFFHFFLLFLDYHSYASDLSRYIIYGKLRQIQLASAPLYYGHCISKRAQAIYAFLWTTCTHSEAKFAHFVPFLRFEVIYLEFCSVTLCARQ